MLVLPNPAEAPARGYNAPFLGRARTCGIGVGGTTTSLHLSPHYLHRTLRRCRRDITKSPKGGERSSLPGSKSNSFFYPSIPGSRVGGGFSATVMGGSGKGVMIQHSPGHTKENRPHENNNCGPRTEELYTWFAQPASAPKPSRFEEILPLSHTHRPRLPDQHTTTGTKGKATSIRL